MSNVIGYILILPIRFYQIFLSPILSNVLGVQCRYEPSCSQYMIEAIREWGPIKGVWLGLKRIGRCQPWGGFGDDPVPENPKKGHNSFRGVSNVHRDE